MTDWRHGKAKLDDRQVREIKALFDKMKGYEIAALYGVSPATISLIRQGKAWRHVQ